jgi:transketolase
MGRTLLAEPIVGIDIAHLSINTIRTLSIDAVEQARSGHPGTPMALAPLVYTLWNRVLQFDPEDPIWPNRDRFVLSNGHASMLLWSVLHLTRTRAVNSDYERLGEPAVSLEDIRHFRQLDSKAPGHPEYGWVSGVETTTGPLGQGVATSVEDGPTHQPVEHLASLRAIPGLVTFRPGDANEVVEAYRYIMRLRHQPAVLALSRQPLPTLDRTKYAPASGVALGAYVLADSPEGVPEVILIASGSELILAVEAHEKLISNGIRSRVVSMPSWEVFENQTRKYRNTVLPPEVTARISI